MIYNDKSSYRFTTFDIVEYYPSITKQLLNDALIFAKSVTNITEDECEIVLHARKSLIFSDGAKWVKKVREDPLFDVAMGAYDGAEICDLIGVYILNKLAFKFPEVSAGLFRDDGLLSTKGLTARQLDILRKNLISFFAEFNLRITVDCNLKSVNFLDATFDLSKATYAPYRKPNDKMVYINKFSNHPPGIKKNLVKNIAIRLSDLSSTRNIFEDKAPIYRTALAVSNLNEPLIYNDHRHNRRRRRNRRILWFNPVYNETVDFKIGREFLKLVTQHFPPSHKFHRIFNKYNVKLSYACLPNLASIIATHNKKILKGNTQLNNMRLCNCPNSSACPVNQKCLTKNVVYKATLTALNGPPITKMYTGSTMNELKFRIYQHLYSFRHEERRNTTKLSKLVWNLHDRGIGYEIKWNILDNAQPYRQGTFHKKPVCRLCLAEKYYILFQNSTGINERTELVKKCSHISRFLMSK
ncbi:hypothetical protein Ahia01_000461700 [Argonauta hians]